MADQRAAGARPAPRQGAQAIERVLDLLDVIASEKDGVETGEIADSAGLSVSTTYRMLRTLAERGYVTRAPSGPRYLLGPKVTELGFAHRMQITASPRVRDFLKRLHDDQHGASYLAVLHGEQVVVTHIHDSGAHPRVGGLRVGYVDDTERTAFGRLLLRNRATEDLAGRGVSHEDLPALLDQVRLVSAQREEVEVEFEEYRPGVACIAAPVRSGRGTTIGAVAMSLTPEDLRVRRDELERAVRRTALLVSSQLES